MHCYNPSNLLQNPTFYEENKLFSFLEQKAAEDEAVEAIVLQNVILMLSNTSAYPFLSSRKYRCYFCEEKFEEPEHFRSHTDLIHKDENIWSFVNKSPVRVDITNLTCRLCLRGFTRLETIANHLNEEHRLGIDTSHSLGLLPFKLDGNFVCTECSYDSSSMRSLVMHLVKEHFCKYICELCGEGFSTHDGYFHHMTLKHKAKKNFVCFVCEQEFDTIRAKREHLTLSYDCRSAKCKTCKKLFPTKRSLEEHALEVHGLQTKKYYCKLCNSVFNNRSALHIHTSKVHYDKYKCKQCGETWATYSTLQRHIRSAHTGDRPYQCKLCNKAYFSKAYLNRHKITHDDALKIPCSICSRRYVRPDYLKLHMQKMHSN